MSKLKVYISSTYRDLVEIRTILRDFFNKQGSNHFELVKIMEHMYDDGTSAVALDVCLEEVEKCDVYIIILGKSAGSFPPNDTKLTYTHHEYLKAIDPSNKKPKKIFRFIDANYNEETCPNVASYNNLKNAITERGTAHEFKNLQEFKILYLEAFYTLTDRYTAHNALNLNRTSEISLFSANAFRPSPTSCSLFVYKANSQDKPEYFNYRLKELLNTQTTVTPKSFFVYLNVLNVVEGDTSVLYHFLLNCLKVLNIAIDHGVAFTTPTEITDYFYSKLAQCEIKNLVIPIKITPLEIHVKQFQNNLMSLLNHFDFTGNSKDIFVHFVICFDIPTLDDTIELYAQLKKDFNIQNHVTLNNINDYDIDMWLENSDYDVLTQMQFKEDFNANLVNRGLQLPQKLGIIELPFEETINNIP